MAITPYLYYRDVGAALAFLAKAFGFRKTGEQMKDASGRIVHAAMQLGDDVVMMGSPGLRFKGPKRLGQATQSLYVTIEKVDTHFARATKAGAHVLQAPTDTEYGHRRYGVEDPEGHQWYFAHEIRSTPAPKPKARRPAPARARKR